MGATVYPYAGIGSRKTPQAVCAYFTGLAAWLRQAGWTLYTGTATGADAAFAQGAGDAVLRFAPWPGHNGVDGHTVPYEAWEWALDVARRHHPQWDRLMGWARMLHVRNVFQLAGCPATGWERARFVACWTPDGAERWDETSRDTGGTGQAIRVATSYQIPVFNFARADAIDRLTTHLAAA